MGGCFFYAHSVHAARISKATGMKIFSTRKRRMLSADSRYMLSSSMELLETNPALVKNFFILLELLTSPIGNLTAGEPGQWEMAPVIILHLEFFREVSLGFKAK